MEARDTSAFVKTIYSGFSRPFWVDIAEKLADESNWYPVYWLAKPNAKTMVESKFPRAIFHNSIDAIKGIPVSKYDQNSLCPLTANILKEYSECQLTVLKMMDRIDALGSFRYSDRVRLFHYQLRYWLTVLDDLEPDIVVFTTIPHMIFDFVLYEICKRRKIQTFMFESTPMRGLVFGMSDFEVPSRAEVLYKKLQNESGAFDVNLSPATENYLQVLQGKYENVPSYMRRAYKEELPKIQSSSASKSLWSKLTDFKNYEFYFNKQKEIYRRRVKAPQNYLKQPGKKIEDSSMSRLEYTIFNLRSKRAMRRLEAHYHKLTQAVGLDKPYIYVALSYQPERTTSPMGSVFVNQLLMVDLLAKLLPNDWNLYVKEHPTQFTKSKYFRAQSGRTSDFYDDLVFLPNVTLVRMKTSSFDLIDNAKAVAVVTGSVGWESVHRGTPALVFGNPWYRGCEGTFRMKTYESCEIALQALQNGYQIDENKLRLFTYALEQTGIDAYVEPHLRVAQIDDRENAARLTRALQEMWLEQKNFCSGPEIN